MQMSTMMRTALTRIRPAKPMEISSREKTILDQDCRRSPRVYRAPETLASGCGIEIRGGEGRGAARFFRQRFRATHTT